MRVRSMMITGAVVGNLWMLVSASSLLAWNPGQFEWRKSWVTLISEQPEPWKKSAHPYFTKRAIEYLRRVKGENYFFANLNDYGGAIVSGSTYADKFKPMRIWGDAVNHYYRFDGDHAFGCLGRGLWLIDSVGEAVQEEVSGYSCSYTDAASYADYIYERAVQHWLGIRRLSGDVPKFDAVGASLPRDLLLDFYVRDNTKEKGAVYLGWAAHLIEDMAQPYHTTNNFDTTRTYHNPFEDAMDTIIRNGKLRVPMDTWTPLGGFHAATAARFNTPAPSSVFMPGLPRRGLRPSAMAIENGQASRYFVNYLKETACVEQALAHGGKPCPNFYEEKWGQVMQVQADRAVKTAAELIAMFMEEVRAPSIVSPQGPSTVSPQITDLPSAAAYGGGSRRIMEVKVDRNPRTKGLILDGRWAGAWHEGLATSTTDTITLDASSTAIPEGMVELRVRACYGGSTGICTGVSPSTFVVVDRTPPTVRLMSPPAGSAFSDAMRVEAVASDNRQFGVATTSISALFGKETIRQTTGQLGAGQKIQTWTTLVQKNEYWAWVNQTVSAWPEGTVTLRAEACDKAGNCVLSATQTVRIDRSGVDLVVQSMSAGAPTTVGGQKRWPITAVVRNNGGKSAGAFKVALKWGPSTISTAVESVGLPGGASRSYQLFTTVDPNSCGTFDAVVDPENVVPEVNETNNLLMGGRIC